MKPKDSKLDKPMFWLTATVSVVLLPLLAILLGAGTNSIWWIVGFVGFPLVVTWALTALQRLCSAPDGMLENSAFAHLDLQTIGVALTIILIAVFHFASSRSWNFQTKWTSPSSDIKAPADIFIDNDYRKSAMPQTQFEVFMAGCDQMSAPIRIERIDRNSYARCGRIWPEVLTFAARSSEFDPAAEAWLKRDTAAARLD